MSRQLIAKAFLDPEVGNTIEDVARAAGVSEAEVDDFADDVDLTRTDGGFVAHERAARRIKAIAQGDIE